MAAHEDMREREREHDGKDSERGRERMGMVRSRDGGGQERLVWMSEMVGSEERWRTK